MTYLKTDGLLLTTIQLYKAHAKKQAKYHICDTG